MKFRNLKRSIIGLSIVALAALFAWWILHDLSKEYIVALISAMVSVFSIIYSNAKAKEKENTARLHSEKAEAYSKVFSLVNGFMHSEKLGKKVPEQNELMKKFIEVKESLMIWASQETLLAFDEIANTPRLPEADKSFVTMSQNLGALYLAMRKDLGHKDDKLSPVKMMSFYLNAEAKKEIFGA